MAKNTTEKFKTMIGGQALIEGIMMRGPEKDACVIRGKDGLQVEVTDRKVRPKGSFSTWPLIRGPVSFFDAQVAGVKALMRSADLSPEEGQEEQTSKLDRWLEKKLGDKKFQSFLIGSSVALGLAMSIGLFFLLPAVIGSLFSPFIQSHVVQNLLEGAIRVIILAGYMILAAQQKDVKRLFAYHGAEHKTIRCYEAGLELTVDNVRVQSKHHPRCGTSFLFIIMILSILVFSVAQELLLTVAPSLLMLKDTALIGYNLIMIGFKLLLLPVVVSVTYEINRFVGRHDNWFTRILSAPGMWMQRISTNEPDDGMMEVAITALQAVIPEQEGADRW